MALRSLVSALPDSQGGSGRHKCVICAFAAGAAMDFWIHKEGGGYSSGGPGIDNAGDLTPMQTGGASASHHFTPRKVSYSANAAIGVAGELWVLHSEKRRLLSEDRSDLSDRVVHVSVELGDGAGYDILSFDSRGDETHIEVKTTTGPAEAPFYITKNELEYAKLWSQSYKLIRLYDFNESLNTASVVEYTAEDLLTMELEPVSFRCWPPTK